jgi:hypothetical protein
MADEMDDTHASNIAEKMVWQKIANSEYLSFFLTIAVP